MKILVAYGSSNGSTLGIAERIQTRLNASNIGAVTLSSVEQKPNVDDFDAIVIGSCIHIGSWIASSQKFVTKIVPKLQANPKPTWAFSVGLPPESRFAQEEADMKTHLEKSIPLKDHKLFWGAIEKEKLGFVGKILFTCFRGKSEDKRDWEQIEGWADGIVKALKAEGVVEEAENRAA